MSAVRSILLHLDATRAATARLALGRALAQRSDAALSAMYVTAPPQPALQLALAEAPAALAQDTDPAALERVRQRFEDALALGGPAMQWLERDPSSDPVDAFCREALCADLLLLGQHDPHAAPGTAAPADFVESAIVRSGRPALVLPCGHAGAALGQRVLVGWNASPSAAHALTAALPWLREARAVHVLQGADDARPSAAGGLDIARYLGFHGIVAHVHRACLAPPQAGDALLALAGDVGADLLVMGCYGRSRAREVVLGGASRTVLRAMTLPVLMAH